jgi:hypothetical protein
MRLVTRTAAALLTTAVVLTGTAVSATADSDTVKDRASDVITWPSKDPGATATRLGYQASVDSGVDLRSMRVRHDKRTITVTAKFSNLGPSTRLYVNLRLNGKKKITRFVFAQDGTARIITPKFNVKCTRPLVVRTGPKGLMKAVFKRSCLSNPRTIKASAFVTTPAFDQVAAPQIGDFGSAGKIGQWSWTRWLKRG